MKAFRPAPDSTVSIAATTASASAAIAGSAGRGEFTVRVYNAGSATVFVKFGDTITTATTSNMPIPAGAVEVFSVQDSDGSANYVAAITASGSATVYVTTGEGI